MAREGGVIADLQTHGVCKLMLNGKTIHKVVGKRLLVVTLKGRRYDTELWRLSHRHGPKARARVPRRHGRKTISQVERSRDAIVRRRERALDVAWEPQAGQFPP